VEDVLSDLRKYRESSGTDEQMDLQAVQAVPICTDGARTMRVWFNDGRIRDFDCWPMIREGKNLYKRLEDEQTFSSLLSIFNGAPGFDFGGNHDGYKCMDFDPYYIWAGSREVTAEVHAEENAAN